MIHYISAEHITIEQIGEIIQQGIRIELSEDAKHRIRRCRSYLDKKINGNNAPIYGVTTGFGSLCNVSIGKDQLSQLQVNLIKSHACGTGERVPNEIVKIMLLLKIQSLSYGYSGCKLDTVQRLVALFNNNAYPVVYTMPTPWSTSRARSEHRATSCRWPTCACRWWDSARWSIKDTSYPVPSCFARNAGSPSSLAPKRDWHCSTARRT